MGWGQHVIPPSHTHELTSLKGPTSNGLHMMVSQEVKPEITPKWKGVRPWKFSILFVKENSLFIGFLERYMILYN